jgi:predicted enzyme related to lactoylglutathione lyase
MHFSEAFVALASVQFLKTVEFYEALFRQSPQPLIPNQYAQWTLKGGLKLGIFCPQASHRQEFAADHPGAMSLCLEVEDIEAAILHLSQMGYPPPSSIQTASHGREVYAYDPEGNRLILHQGWANQAEPR